MDEDTDLKSAGLKGFGGSIPFLSATIKMSDGTLTYVGIARWTISSRRVT